jgi:hypothetical protein
MFDRFCAATTGGLTFAPLSSDEPHDAMAMSVATAAPVSASRAGRNCDL